MRQSADDRLNTVIKLAKRAVARNDQAAYDMLTDTIEREQLFLDMKTDAGEQITSMDQVHADLWQLAQACGTAEE